jgi:YfiH family protein
VSVVLAFATPASRWIEYQLHTARGVVVVRASNAHFGDLRPSGLSLAELAERRVLLAPVPWNWVRQVHGADVVESAGPTIDGDEGDALITSEPDRTLAVHLADCGGVALVSDTGLIAAVHVGWRGALAGVMGASVDSMRGRGAGEIAAVLSPCIHSRNYEFGDHDLQAMVARFGPGVASTTAWGTPALDLPAVITGELRRLSVEVLAGPFACTAADPDYFSHRARGDSGRQALVVFRRSDAGET